MCRTTNYCYFFLHCNAPPSCFNEFLNNLCLADSAVFDLVFNLNCRINEALFYLQTEAAPQDGSKADKPVQTSLERPQKPTIEKPHRASADKVKPNTETTSKSPPPPPPRRFYASGTGLTTGRSGEVIFTSRKESTSAQVRVLFQIPLIKIHVTHALLSRIPSQHGNFHYYYLKHILNDLVCRKLIESKLMNLS